MGALDTHNLEQHEYMDRSRAYSKRIESGRIKLPEAASCLLKDIPAPERILAADPLAAEDQELVSIKLNPSSIAFVAIALNPMNEWMKVMHEFNIQVTEMLNKAVTALGDVKVEHKEDLVVPFLSWLLNVSN